MIAGDHMFNRIHNSRTTTFFVVVTIILVFEAIEDPLSRMILFRYSITFR